MEPYHKEPEVREFTTRITGISDGKYVTLEKSYFYPNGGGQPHDEGELVTEDGTYPVVFVGRFNGVVSHEIKGEHSLRIGDEVRCVIDDERRSKHTRAHTAEHIFSAVVEKETGALVSGNQITTEKLRVDLSLEKYDPEKFKDYVTKANDIIAKNHDVHSEMILRNEMDESLAKLTKGFPDHIQEVRVLSIGDFDKQACGGTHVTNTKDIGRLELIKVQNKGAKNRRVYLRVLP